MHVLPMLHVLRMLHVLTVVHILRMMHVLTMLHAWQHLVELFDGNSLVLDPLLQQNAKK